MTTDEIVNYVMYTSHNTNPAVLRDLLNSVETGGGGGVVAAIGQETGALDKTFGEIKTALLSGAQIWITAQVSSAVNYFPVDNIVANTAGGGTINVASMTLTAATDSDYPSAGDPPK